MDPFYLLLNLFILAGLTYLVWRGQGPDTAPGLRRIFLPALFLKLLAGILLGLLYQELSGGKDTFTYQNQSLFLTDYLYDSPGAYLRLWLTHRFESETTRTSMIFVWYSNSYFMVILLSFLNLFTGSQYYLNALYFSFFSFFGSWQLVRALSRIWPQTQWAAVSAFLFFPSVLFWSAGITKEAVFTGAIGLFLASGLDLIYDKSRRPLLTALSGLAGGVLLWKIKFYYGAILFPLMGSFALIRWLPERVSWLQKGWQRALGFAAVLTTLALVISRWNEVIRTDYFLRELMKSYQVLLVRSAGKPVLVFPDLQPTLGSVARNAPSAAWQATFRPYIWEGEGMFYKVAGIENLFLFLILVLAGLAWMRHGFKKPDLFSWVLLVYVVVMAALIGLTTPNVGSLNRYRIAYLPLLVYILLRQAGWWDQLVSRFTGSKR